MPDRKRNWDKSKAGQDYRHGYDAEHYDIMRFTLPKGTKAVIDQAAEAEGISKSQLVARAVNQYVIRKAEAPGDPLEPLD